MTVELRIAAATDDRRVITTRKESAHNDSRIGPLRADARAWTSADPGNNADHRHEDERSGLDEHGRADSSCAICLRRNGLYCAGHLLRRFRFFCSQRVRELQFANAVDLSAHQRLGQPRRLDDAVGVDPCVFRRAGRRLRQQSTCGAQGQRARRAGLDCGGV